jgi:hypothetical protein
LFGKPRNNHSSFILQIKIRKNMIGEIIKLVQADEWRGVSQRVEVAKGKNKLKRTWADVLTYFKRLQQWPKK